MSHHLDEALQSAYKNFDSSETALVKVHNDILCKIDNETVIRLLLNLSTAFDTVDHSILLRDLFWAPFSISSPHHLLPTSFNSTCYGVVSTLMILSCIYLLNWLKLAKRRVEWCVNYIDCCIVNNGLKLNQEKTELVLITSQFRSRPSLEFIQVGDEKIQAKSSAGNLGLLSISVLT